MLQRDIPMTPEARFSSHRAPSLYGAMRRRRSTAGRKASNASGRDRESRPRSRYLSVRSPPPRLLPSSNQQQQQQRQRPHPQTQHQQRQQQRQRRSRITAAAEATPATAAAARAATVTARAGPTTTAITPKTKAEERQ